MTKVDPNDLICPKELVFDIVVRELRDLRHEQRTDHEKLVQKINDLEKDLVALKTKATIWGSIAGLLVVIAMEIIQRFTR